LSKLECPKCGSENIDQYRHITSPIWCEDCGFGVDNKNKNNPFTENDKDK